MINIKNLTTLTTTFYFILKLALKLCFSNTLITRSYKTKYKFMFNQKIIENQQSNKIFGAKNLKINVETLRVVRTMNTENIIFLFILLNN